MPGGRAAMRLVQWCGVPQQWHQSMWSLWCASEWEREGRVLRFGATDLDRRHATQRPSHFSSPHLPKGSLRTWFKLETDNDCLEGSGSLKICFLFLIPLKGSPVHLQGSLFHHQKDVFSSEDNEFPKVGYNMLVLWSAIGCFPWG